MRKLLPLFVWLVLITPTVLVLLTGTAQAQGHYRVFVANTVGDSLSVIDTDTNFQTASIPVGDLPRDVAAMSDGSRVYVGDVESNTVSVIDGLTLTVTANISVPTPQFLAISPDNSRVWVVSQANSEIWVIDTSSNTVVGAIPVASAFGIAVNPSGTFVYVTNQGLHTVSVIDTNSLVVVATVPTGPPSEMHPTGIAVNPQGTRVYVTNTSDNSVAVIDAATNTLIDRVASPYPTADLWGITVNPTGTLVFAVASNGFIDILDAATNSFVGTIAVGHDPRDVAFSPDGLRMYVTNHTDDTVSIIDTTTNSVVSTVSVGVRPWGVIITPIPNNTLAGTNVSVQTNSATLTFSNVTASGTTTVTSIDAATAGQIPGGFAVSELLAYQIETTATFTGTITMAFVIAGPISETDFDSLVILHNENGILTDVTTISPPRNYATRTIYAVTNSLSPFYLVRTAQHIVALFDQTRAYKQGSTIPIKIKSVNNDNVNLSSGTIVATVRSLVLVGGNVSSTVVDPGNSNPDHNFRYDSSLGGYIFNLSSKGLASGTYVLSFYIGTDHTFFYTVRVEIK